MDMKSTSQAMETEKIPRLLAQLAIPAVVAQIINLLYNIVDRIYIGHISGVGAAALTGVGLFTPILMLINAFAMLAGSGGAPRAAISMGKKDNKTAEKILGNCFALLILMAVILTVVFFTFAPQLLTLFGASEKTLPYGVAYARIYILGSIFVLIVMGMNPFITTQGFAKISMMTTIIGAVINIILDPVLIFGLGPFPKMGIEGAALATGIGQAAGAVLYLIFYIVNPLPVKYRKKYLKADLKLWKKLYVIGIPASLNLALPSLLISVLNVILTGYGEVYVFVLGVYYKLQTFLYLPANGIVQGMRPLLGYNYGAGEIKRVKKLFGISVLLNGMIMLVGTIICFTASETLMGMFTENPETVRLGTAALQIISIGFIPSAISVTASGALEGLSKGAQSLVISLLRYIIVIIPAAYLLCHFAGADAVWNAFWICEFITAVVVGIGIKYYWNRLLQ